MSSHLNILKWLFALVLIFGGFTVYKIFGGLAADLEGKEYVWLVGRYLRVWFIHISGDFGGFFSSLDHCH